MKFENEFVKKTREHFGSLCKQLIKEVKEGRLVVNDPIKYIAWQQDRYKKIMNGEYDDTFTHKQYEMYLATGETHPLLP